MKKMLVIAGAVLVVAAVGSFWWLESGGRSASTSEGAKAAASGPRKKAVSAAAPAKAEPVPEGKAEPKGRAKGKGVVFEGVLDDPDHPYSEADKALARELHAQLDGYDAFADVLDDLELGDVNDPKVVAKLTPEVQEALAKHKKFLEVAVKACESENPSVRSQGIEALSWMGYEALPHLTPLMGDPDADVAEAAVSAVEHSLNEVPNSALRFEAAAAYMTSVTANRDAMTMLGGTLTSAALEIIDPTSDSPAAKQRALDNRNQVVAILTELIDGGDPRLAEAAKEAYSDITSEDWISREESERWAADPDNYEAPDGDVESVGDDRSSPSPAEGRVPEPAPEENEVSVDI